MQIVLVVKHASSVEVGRILVWQDPGQEEG